MIRVLSLSGIALAGVLALAGCRGPAEQSPREAADQPIAFFHSVHAGQNQIPCQYCHYTADRSPSAGIPSVQQCVGCHVPGSAVIPPEQAQLAFPQADRDSMWNAEATKLLGYWKEQRAIPWVRVHKLPEHVRFTHEAHVRVGLECQTCHGPVEEMDRVYRYSSLQMGWCVDCHRGNLPISDAEEAAVRERSTFVAQVRELATAGIDVGGQTGTHPNQRARTDCFVCHY